MDIKQIRAQFPQYDDMSDNDLVGAIHKKYYADIPYADFAAKVGYTSPMREKVAEGITLQPFGLDTGIEMPQWLTEGLAGAGRRMAQIGTLGMYDTPEAADELLDDSVAATIGGAATDIGAMAAGGAGLKALGAIPKVGGLLSTAGQALSAPKSIGQAMAGMGAYGAATSEDRLSGGLSGLIGGGVGYAIPKVAGAVIKPAIQKGAKALTDRGVRLTPGQLLGGGAQRVEDAATSIPLIGDLIKNRQRASFLDFNKAAVDDALGIVGKSLPKGVEAGREAIAYADDAISSMYDDILPNMTVSVDAQLASDLAKINGMVASLRPQERGLIERNINSALEKELNNPTQTALGQSFKTLTRSIRENYKSWLKSNSAYEQEAGKAAREIHKALIEAAKRQNPNLGTELSRVDAAYAAISRARDASVSAGAKEGVFTPAMLSRQVKKGSQGKAYAKGKAYGQELSDAAQSVLPATVPDSGTPMRSLVGLGILGGGAYLSPDAAVPLAGLGLMYTPAGRALASRMISVRPPLAAPTRALLERTAPYAGLLGAGVQINQQ
jgi:hypothetical protein